MLVKINRKKKDKLIRNQFLNTELKRRYYKFMRIQALKSYDKINYLKYQGKLASLPKTTKINNYCYLTGRSKGVLRGFRLSRHQIREKFKYLNGLTNSSW